MAEKIKGQQEMNNNTQNITQKTADKEEMWIHTTRGSHLTKRTNTYQNWIKKNSMHVPNMTFLNSAPFQK
jgi:uncharacterized HAD superfamily protein